MTFLALDLRCTYIVVGVSGELDIFNKRFGNLGLVLEEDRCRPACPRPFQGVHLQKTAVVFGSFLILIITVLRLHINLDGITYRLRPTPKLTLVATSELSSFLLFYSTTLLGSQGSDSAWEICNSRATLCDK